MKRALDAPFITALFHPDYDRRLWVFTRSADTLKGPLVGSWDDAHIPPVGNFAPP